MGLQAEEVLTGIRCLREPAKPISKENFVSDEMITKPYSEASTTDVPQCCRPALVIISNFYFMRNCFARTFCRTTTNIQFTTKRFFLLQIVD